MKFGLSLAMAASLLSPTVAFAQGSIVQGQVRDSTLGIVADVRVTITGPSLSAPLTTLTAKAGRYEFTNVSDGIYDLVFDTSMAMNCPSFQHSGVVQRRIVVADGFVTEIDIKLPSGPTDLTVEALADNRIAQVTRSRIAPAAPQVTLLLER